jgi:hypothetical protein
LVVAQVAGSSGDLGKYAAPIAGAFGTTFAWSVWLTLAAIPTALVLTRRERVDRRARADLDPVRQSAS